MAVLDSILEPFMKSVSELPCVEFCIFSVATCAWFVIWMATSTRTVPVAELIPDFDAVGLDSPRLLDHAAVASDKAKSAPMEVHWLKPKFCQHCLDRRLVPEGATSRPLHGDFTASFADLQCKDVEVGEQLLEVSPMLGDLPSSSFVFSV